MLCKGQTAIYIRPRKKGQEFGSRIEGKQDIPLKVPLENKEDQIFQKTQCDKVDDQRKPGLKDLQKRRENASYLRDESWEKLSGHG